MKPTRVGDLKVALQSWDDDDRIVIADTGVIYGVPPLSPADHIGLRIGSFRQLAGLTQQELADLCGMERSAIGKVESGHRRCRSDELATIAAVLGIQPSDLLEAQK